LQADLLQVQKTLEQIQNQARASPPGLLQKDRALQAAVIERPGALETKQNEQVERQLEFAAKLASLNQEISNTGIRLSEELQQIKTLVHSHSRMWERLGRSWPIRVLFYFSREK